MCVRQSDFLIDCGALSSQVLEATGLPQRDASQSEGQSNMLELPMMDVGHSKPYQYSHAATLSEPPRLPSGLVRSELEPVHALSKPQKFVGATFNPDRKLPEMRGPASAVEPSNNIEKMQQKKKLPRFPK